MPAQISASSPGTSDGRRQSAWLFGPMPDLLLGSGLLYLLFVAGLILTGDSVRDEISPVVGSYLIMVISGAHYGATLLRVYEHRAERRTYRIFTVYGTAIMLAVLIGALYSPLAGSVLITLYLTWSPWHYTGQNYGIAVMLLRRRGIEISPASKRWLYASFVLSFVSVALNFHFEGGVSQQNPLGYQALNTGTFHFLSIGLPGAFREILMPLVAVGYLVSISAAIFLLLRAGSLAAIAPSAVVMLLQAVWFSIPHIGFYLDWTAGVPALDPVGGERFRFYFLWTAVGHAIQYLWITTYYAKADARWRGFSRYFGKTFVFGNAVWAAPVMLLGPEAIGRPDFESGLAMCVASAVNIHHFMLDGAIWKLRNPKIAAILFRNTSEDVEGKRASTARPLWRSLAWTVAGFFCLANVLPQLEIEQRLPHALRSGELSTATAILDRAAYYGRDSANWRAHLANQLVKTQEPSRAIPHYRRSLKFHPQADGFMQLGKLVRKLDGLEPAIAVWTEGVSHFPDDYALLFQLGQAIVEAGRPQAARPYIERAAALRRNDVLAKRALNTAGVDPPGGRDAAR